MSSRTSHSNGSRKSTRPSRRAGARKRASVPARSRRFSPEEHAHALSLIAAGMKRDEVATSVGCTTESLRRRYKEAKRKGLVVVAPRDPGAGLGEHETKAILSSNIRALVVPRGPTIVACTTISLPASKNVSCLIFYDHPDDWRWGPELSRVEVADHRVVSPPDLGLLDRIPLGLAVTHHPRAHDLHVVRPRVHDLDEAHPFVGMALADLRPSQGVRDRGFKLLSGDHMTIVGSARGMSSFRSRCTSADAASCSDRVESYPVSWTVRGGGCLRGRCATSSASIWA